MTASEVETARSARGAHQPPPASSSLYVGRLRHRRHRPTPHAFGYGVYHVLLDLDDLDRLDREVGGFGYNRAAVTTFHDTDHLGPEPLPVRVKLARWLAGNGVTLPRGRVLLLTNLRVLGHVFNPVSWFYCYDPDDRLVLVVAEVNNTFGESYAYLLDDLHWRDEHTATAGRQKVFHVSPFLDIPEHHYTFTLRPPGERLVVHMDVHDGDGRIFDATLAERQVELTTRTLVRALVRHPLLPLHTVALIHWNALQLWWKRTPFFRKPEPPDNRYGVVSEQRVDRDDARSTSPAVDEPPRNR